MAGQQKRMLTMENGKLGKVDIVSLLRKGESWALLSPESREQLYALLPERKEGDPPHDPDVHPLTSYRFKEYIEAELRQWQDDLVEGRETKKWRAQALQAHHDHVDGKFDDYKVTSRDEYWGKPAEDDAITKAEKDGDVVAKTEGGDVDDGGISEQTARSGVNGTADAAADAAALNDWGEDGGKAVNDSETEESEL